MEDSFPTVLKDGNFVPGQVQLIMGCDPTDAGQLLLWRAFREPVDAFAFRAVFPDGVTAREWRALVVGVFEVWDQVNRVIMLQVDTLLTGLVWRSSEG